MKIIDTHAHIDQLKDLPGSLARAKEAGVCAVVVPSMDLVSCKRNLEIAEQFSDIKIYIELGMHPSDVNLSELDQILQLIRQNRQRIVAVGEIGLDFWYKWVRHDEDKKREQITSYSAFLRLAKELDLPAVIHSRGAWRECLDIALQAGVKKAEFHWYSGPLDVLDEILEAGYYVSTSPSVLYSQQSREAMARAVPERTLIETDCPVYYRDPDTGEGFEAEPRHVWKTLKAYAELKNISEDRALKQLNQNAVDFFNLEPSLAEG